MRVLRTEKRIHFCSLLYRFRETEAVEISHEIVRRCAELQEMRAHVDAGGSAANLSGLLISEVRASIWSYVAVAMNDMLAYALNAFSIPSFEVHFLELAKRTSSCVVIQNYRSLKGKDAETIKAFTEIAKALGSIERVKCMAENSVEQEYERLQRRVGKEVSAEDVAAGIKELADGTSEIATGPAYDLMSRLGECAGTDVPPLAAEKLCACFKQDLMSSLQLFDRLEPPVLEALQVCQHLYFDRSLMSVMKVKRLFFLLSFRFLDCRLLIRWTNH